jgi:hypothetical protein
MCGSSSLPLGHPSRRTIPFLLVAICAPRLVPAVIAGLTVGFNISEMLLS